jgi:hypothetical protein
MRLADHHGDRQLDAKHNRSLIGMRVLVILEALVSSGTTPVPLYLIRAGRR